MQPKQVQIRSAPFSELFDKAPTDNPEIQQEQWLPAVPLVGEFLRASHPALAPSTWELHHCICTSIRQFKVLLLSSLNIPKSPHADWGLTGWEEGSFPPARWLHFPTARQQPQLTSTFTNRPAVQTALCELPFSCLYYGKHRSFW